MHSNQAGFQHRYLRLGDLRRLEQMLFTPRKAVEGRFAGHYQTRQRGQSVEFRDYREYLPGDEVAAIDWKAYGRTDKLFVRLFEHQSELTVQLLVDASASMAYQGGRPPGSRLADSKYDYACRLAASIAFLILKQHDRFSLAIAQQGLHRRLSPEGTMAGLAGALRTMETIRPKGAAGLAAAIDELSRSGARRPLLLIFSDLLDDAEATAKAVAARVHSGGEAVVFHILHPDELRLPDMEWGTFIDSESGERARLNVDEIREEYAERMRSFLDAWSARFSGMGVDSIRATTSEPYYETLQRYLVRRASFMR